jgi:hypothetical protein
MGLRRMGILQRRHLSRRGEVIGPALKTQVEDEAEGLEMAASRLHLGATGELAQDEEFQEIVSYLGDAAKRLRALVEDL